MDTKALRQKILDLAIRGKLVPQDPTDEPASVLLERIRAEKQQMVKDGRLKAKDIKNDTAIFLGDDNLHYEKFSDGTVKCIEDEIPFELPEGWRWDRLGNISNIARGGSPRPIESYITDDENGVNWIKISDTEKGGKYIYRTKEKIKPEGLTKSRYVESGDFLLTNSMSFGRPYILKTDGCIHDGWLVIGNIDTVFDQDFLYYALSSSFMYQTLSLLAAGSTVKNLKSDTVKSVLFPIPPMQEQKRIAEKLASLISFVVKIDSTKTDLQTTIQQTKSKILDLAIRGKLVPQDPNDEPASVLLERIKAEKEELIKQGKIKRDKKESVIFKGEDNSYYEKIGDSVTCIDEELPFNIPKNWTWIRLSSACIINPKNSMSDDTVVSFVPMTLIQDGYTNEFTFEHRKWGEVKKGFTHFAENDVGFAKITPCFENRKSVIFRDLCNGYGAGTTELYILRTLPDTIIPEYILYTVKTESFLVGGKQTCAGVVGQQRISKDYVCDYLVPVPPLNEQVRIIKKCAEIMTMLHKIEKNLS